MIKFALIKERKTPLDRRVVFSPEKLKEVIKKFPKAKFKVESSDVRIFSDQEYRDAGFEVSEDISDCEILLGVKEVPIPALIPEKKYFFFSHTIKKQPYNRDLLRTVLEKNIELYDHEGVVKENGARLIGFGRYAGLVGAYNCFRALGLRDDLYKLPKAENLANLNVVLAELNRISVPPKKVILTGSGKVAKGAKEILDHLKINQVEVDDFLNKDFDHPVYCLLDVLDYNIRKDGKKGSKAEFYKFPERYETNFVRFAKVAEILITGHFYGVGAPEFFTKEDANSFDFKIDLVADISCDVNGPVASTIRPSTIAEPFYGYDPETRGEVDYREKGAITVMAVDNLPCELPRDASEGFGKMFLQHVIPAFFNGDKDEILTRAKMTENGKLSPRFEYLQEYVDGFIKPNEYA